MSKTPVPVLRIGKTMWANMSPQEQMLFVVQQLVGFLASEFFSTMEGMEIHVVDAAVPNKPEVILHVGMRASSGGQIVMPGNDLVI